MALEHLSRQKFFKISKKNFQNFGGKSEQGALTSSNLKFVTPNFMDMKCPDS